MSEAKALPPGEFTLNTIALILSSSLASLIASTVVIDPIVLNVPWITYPSQNGEVKFDHKDDIVADLSESFKELKDSGNNFFVNLDSLSDLK